MIKFHFILALILFPAALRGADINFDPALAPAAATYRVQTEKLRETRINVIIAAQDLYLAELKSADEKATKAGDTKALTAIAQERKAVSDVRLTPEPSSDLPRKVIPTRNACLKATEKANEDLSKALQKLNAEYLVALGKIQSTAAANNTAIVEQIEAEKKRVISGNFGPMSDFRLQLAGTRWSNGASPPEIRRFNADGKVNGTWRYEITGPTTVVMWWNENSSSTFELDKDGRTLLFNGKPDFTLIVEPRKN